MDVSHASGSVHYHSINLLITEITI